MPGERSIITRGLYDRHAMRAYLTRQLSPTAFNPISANLLPYILPANGRIGSDGTGHIPMPEAIDLDDNKFSGRVDANSGFGLLTAYYYFDKFNQLAPTGRGTHPFTRGLAWLGMGKLRT